MTEPFKFQFQLWFDPKAHQARWHHIERIVGQLEEYVNAGHLLLNPDETAWRYGKPVGIKFELTDAQTQNRDLALAYMYLRIPISLPADWKVPDEYSLQDTQKALLDDIHCPMTLPSPSYQKTTMLTLFSL